MSIASVLVVDDEPGVCYFVEETLADNGYETVAVESGEAALDLIETQTFDVALLDLRMNGIGGLEVLDVLHQRSPNTVAIVLTAHGSMETAIEALRQGAHDYLLKPCDPETLRESVRRGLNKQRHTQRQLAGADLVSDVSNELRAPLTNIHLYLELLERGESEKRAQYLDNLKQITNQMAGLVEDALTLSRLETDDVNGEFALQDLNGLVAQIVAAHQVQVEIAGLELTFEPDAALPPLRVRRRQLVKLVNNLLTNAINYTSAGQVWVSTHLDAERKLACLQIRDTGIGIASEDLPHLFQRFYRGQDAARSNASGNGLGLAIVKEIVALHRGEIEVESQVDEGSRFRVWLPLE